MKYEEFDCITLKDGRDGAIVEVLGDGELYLVDIGSSPKDWDTIIVQPEEILKKRDLHLKK